MDNNNNNNNTTVDMIISKYGKEGYEHLINTLACISNSNKYHTYYFLDNFRAKILTSDMLPRSGYVLEDLDLIVYTYKYNENRFKLLEFKYMNNDLKQGQKVVFGTIDRMLRSSQEGKRYEGFYLVNIDFDNRTVIVNNIALTLERYQAFLKGDLIIKPYKF
jgi:hypothetical protein